jgi:probable HAF family extracellular repeat protein
MTRGFRYSNGAVTWLATLGGNESAAFGINNSGQIVGSATTAAGETHPFLLSSGRMIDLGTLGGTRGAAKAINPYSARCRLPGLVPGRELAVVGPSHSLPASGSAN